MEKHLQEYLDLPSKSKNPSEEAQSAVVPDHAKRRSIQEKIRVALYEQQAAINFIGGAKKNEYKLTEDIIDARFSINPEELASITSKHDLKALKMHGGVDGLSKNICSSFDHGVSASDLDTRQNIYGVNGYAEKPSRSFWMFAWDALQDMIRIIPLVCALLSATVGLSSEDWLSDMYDGLGIILSILLVVMVTAISDYKQSLQSGQGVWLQMDFKGSRPHQVLERMLVDQTAQPTDLPLSLLQQITDNFSHDRQIGTGGFAVVYKGILQSGVKVAVKKLSSTLDVDEKKFIQEVEPLMKTNHKNVVRFLGYCVDMQGKVMQYEGKLIMAYLCTWLLCFEYLPKGSLDQYITDASHGLEWRDRYKIIKGIAQGLHYLHDKRILHLDLKPANILVDATMTPKIADFGLSRCFDENQTKTDISKVVGTPGYLAPELFNNSNLQITFELDIFSLGVIIMEIMTGKRDCSPVKDVVESWKNRLEPDTLQVEQVIVCTEIGIQCINSDPAKRPSTRHIIDRLDHSSIQIGTSTATGSSPVQARWAILVPLGDLLCATARFLGKNTYGMTPKIKWNFTYKRKIDYYSMALYMKKWSSSFF